MKQLSPFWCFVAVGILLILWFLIVRLGFHQLIAGVDSGTQQESANRAARWIGPTLLSVAAIFGLAGVSLLFRPEWHPVLNWIVVIGTIAAPSVVWALQRAR